MKPERWQQLDQLFHSALEREPPERGAFLDEACGGDESLHNQVEALLAPNTEYLSDGIAEALINSLTELRGAVAEVHMKLYEGNVNVYAPSGVSDGRGSYGDLIYVRPNDYERAAEVLKV